MLTLVCAFHPGEDAVVPGGGPIPTWERLSLTLIQEGDCRQSLHSLRGPWGVQNVLAMRLLIE